MRLRPTIGGGRRGFLTVLAFFGTLQWIETMESRGHSREGVMEELMGDFGEDTPRYIDPIKSLQMTAQAWIKHFLTIVRKCLIQACVFIYDSGSTQVKQ
jgi:hypothetical protein